nr:hypothetical protein CFP56_30390 [Quercus suber]
MPFPRIFYYSRCSPLKSFISTVHPSIPIYKILYFISICNSRCFLRLADFHKAVFKPLIFTGSLRLRPSAMGFTDCSRRRSSSMAGCSLCTRSTQLAEILRLIDPLYGAYDFFSILFVCDDDDDDG